MTSIQISFDEEENKIIEEYKKLYSLSNKSEVIRFMVYEVYLLRELAEIDFQLNIEQDKKFANTLISSLLKRMKNLEKEGWKKFIKSDLFEKYEHDINQLKDRINKN